MVIFYLVLVAVNKEATTPSLPVVVYLGDRHYSYLDETGGGTVKKSKVGNQEANQEETQVPDASV